MDAVAAQIQLFAALIASLAPELAVCGHFEHSEWGWWGGHSMPSGKPKAVFRSFSLAGEGTNGLSVSVGIT